MPIIATVNSRNWPSGENTAEAVIPDDVQRVRIAATRENWPDTGAEVLELELWINLGAGWVWLCKCGARGGVHLDRNGVEMPETTLMVPLPPGTNRSVRGVFRRMTALRTGITVETL